MTHSANDARMSDCDRTTSPHIEFATIVTERMSENNLSGAIATLNLLYLAVQARSPWMIHSAISLCISEILSAGEKLSDVMEIHFSNSVKRNI